MLKKPHAVNFTKKNQIHPFEDPSNLQFFSQKNDASLFVIGTHSKKRPHTLTFARMFDHQLLDMMEVSIEHGVPMRDFKVKSNIPEFYIGEHDRTDQPILFDRCEAATGHSINLNSFTFC